MEIYYAIFYPLTKSEGWGVRFPDAPGINTSGKNVTKALKMAMDALSGMLVVGRKGREYEAPRDYDAIQEAAKDGELVFPVVPDESAMNEYRPKKRINIMIPVDLLGQVDEYLKEKKGLDRSRFLCESVKEHLSELTA